MPGEELYSPPQQKLPGCHHLPWALPKVLYAVSEIKRLAGSTQGGGYRMVRYFNRKRNPTQSPGKRINRKLSHYPRTGYVRAR